ncbi:transmembrane protein 51b [Chanos chanos]|uniref:Transmembrane protein 51b n=1 Tax=Chanos chanos TaxID=29144 RepID=A0A6J2VLJ2_CHACN|nr:transmembrane protein 51-like [Chanos chanos]
MCSSGHRLCSGGERSSSNRSGRRGSNSGSQYALCALGFGLVALGIVMIVWTVVPLDAAQNNTSTNPVQEEDSARTSSVAFVLVGAGVAMLLLALCLGLRNKNRLRRRETAGALGTQYLDRVPGEDAGPAEPAPSYDVPSYEEAVASGQYPIRQSNLRQSTSQLPSYEDLIAAVENEGEGPNAGTSQEPPSTTPTPAPEPKPAPPPAATAAAAAPATNQPTRSSSRASRILKPLRVRRIKSEKLHLKDIRLNIPNPNQSGVVNIEPLTPPPQYEDKIPELS